MVVVVVGAKNCGAKVENRHTITRGGGNALRKEACRGGQGRARTGVPRPLTENENKRHARGVAGVKRNEMGKQK